MIEDNNLNNKTPSLTKSTNHSDKINWFVERKKVIIISLLTLVGLAVVSYLLLVFFPLKPAINPESGGRKAGTTPVLDIGFWGCSQDSKTFTSLKEALKNPEQVCTLVLQDQHLTSLTPEIGKLKRIAVLNLLGNNLTTLPDEIGELSNLVELYLGGNQGINIPPTIKKLKHLKEVNLALTGLTQLPVELSEAKYLKTLWLNGNNISPEEKDRIKKLLPNTNITF